MAAPFDSSHSTMTLPNVIHFLQTESTRYERERNYWELERSEMKARIAKLEGDRKASERMKEWYLRRLRMMEDALQDERLKNDPTAKRLPSVVDADHAEKKLKSGINQKTSRFEHDEVYREMTQTSQSILADQTGRTKARTHLEKCLTEVTYLVNAMPAITTTTLSRELPSHSPTSQSYEIGQYHASRDAPVSDALSQEQFVGHLPMNEGATHQDPLDNEPVEQIQHTYDSNGNFVEAQPIPPLTSPASDPDDPNLVVAETWTSADDTWSLGDAVSSSDAPFKLSFSMHGDGQSIADVYPCTLDDRECVVVRKGNSTNIEVYTVPGNSLVCTLTGQDQSATCLLAQSTSGHVHIYSGSSDGVITMWQISANIEAPTTLEPMKRFINHSRAITGLAIVQDILLSISQDGSTRSWDTQNGESLNVWWSPGKDEHQVATAICSMTLGSFAVSYASGICKIYNIHDMKSNLTIPKTQDAIPDTITHLCYFETNTDKLLVCSSEAQVTLLDVAARSVRHVLGEPVTKSCCLSKHMAFLQDSKITIRSSTGASLQQLDLLQGTANCVQSSNDKLYIGLEDGRILIYA